MTLDRKKLLVRLLFASCLCAAAGAQDVVAVLSSAPGPYQAAFDSFQKEFGRKVAVYHLPQDKPVVGRDTRVVVAFGAEAVLRSYPKSATLIACLAPGLPEAALHKGPFVFVAMKPPAPVLLAQMKGLQPRLKRVAVLWNAAYTGSYLSELRRAAASQGIEIEDVRVRDPRDVPDALRGLSSSKPDALWLAPDPVLITPQSFQTIKQFSWDNSIPFYAPTSGLAAAGAAAAISVDNEQTGRQDAQLSRRALSGEALPGVAYSENVELTLNPESAAKAGLTLTHEMLGRADKVLP